MGADARVARDKCVPGHPSTSTLLLEGQLTLFAEGESTTSEPSMIDAFSSSILEASSAGTFDSNSWYGASATPPFSSVPTYGVLLKSPADDVLMVSKTAAWICFMTEV